MKGILNRENLSFGGVYWFLYSGMAVLFGFLVPYLKWAGYKEITIGAMLSVTYLMSVLGPILWGVISDRLKTCRWLLVYNLLVGGASSLLAPATVHSIPLVMGLMVFGTLTYCSMPAIVDGWAMRQKSRGANINYGVIRGMASLAYALANIFCGILLMRFGLNLMFPLICGFTFTTAVVVLLIREIPADVHEKTTPEDIKEDQIAAPAPLLKNTGYLIFIAMATLIYVGNSASQSFYPLLLAQAGGSNADLGLALGLASFSEIPIMFLSALLLKKFKDTTLLVLSMGFCTIRFFLFFSLQTAPALVWSQLTSSLCTGLFIPTAVHYVIRVTPAKLKTTAIAVASSVYMGIGGIIGNAIGGFMSQNLGIRMMYGIVSALAAAVTVTFRLILYTTRKKGIFTSAGKVAV